jgi:hypothetical protein
MNIFCYDSNALGFCLNNPSFYSGASLLLGQSPALSFSAGRREYDTRAPLSSAVASGTPLRYNVQEYILTTEAHHPQPTQRGEMRLQPEIAMKDDHAKRRPIGIQSGAS